MEYLAHLRKSRRHALRLGFAVLDLGDEAAGQALLDDGRGILRRVGDRDALGFNLDLSGHIALVRGDHAAAHELFREMLVTSREMGIVLNEMRAQIGLGDLARAKGDSAAARERYAEALRLGEAYGARSLLAAVAEALRKVAGLSVDAGDAGHAVRIFGAEAAARGAETMLRAPSDSWEHDLELARATLGETAFAAAWAEGRAMTLNEAFANALGVDAAPPGPREPADHAGEPL